MNKLVNLNLIASYAAITVFALGSPSRSMAQLALVVSSPVDHPVAAPTLPRSYFSWNQSSGAWGESYVDHSLKLRGFQEVYEVKSPGGQGIDRVAIKRDGLGKVVDVKFVEVKTHRGGAARLATTKSGRQMSCSWLMNHDRAMRRSPDPNLRTLAGEINDFRKAKGVSMEKLGELHDVNTLSGYHVIRNPITGAERSRMLIERQLRNVQRRSASPATRRHAAISLAVLDQIQATSLGDWSNAGVVRRSLLQATSRSGGTVALAAKTPLQRIVRAAGPIGAAVAVSVEVYGVYSDYGAYQRGEMSRRQFAIVSVGRGGGIAGAAAGAATGAWVGTFGGPVAWITVPVGAGVGGFVGYLAGSTAAGSAANAWLSRLDEGVQKKLDLWVISTPYASMRAVDHHE